MPTRALWSSLHLAGALTWLGSLAVIGQTPPPAAAANPPAAAPAKAADGPKIQFATPVHDFGRTKAGGTIRHDFIFTNTGTAPLILSDVRPGCGCTTAGTWDKEVAPGKTGTIPIQLSTAGMGGSIAKVVTVTSNDPQTPTVTLQIKGTAWKSVDINPASAYFTIPRESATNQTKSIRIVNNLDEPLTLSEPKSTNQNFQVALNTVKPGKEYELLITAVAPFTGSMAQSPITVKTSSKEDPELNIRALAMIQETLMVAPSQLYLPPSIATNLANPTVTVRNTGTRPVRLSEAEINIPGAKVALKEIQPGRVFTLALEVPAGFAPAPGQRFEMKVKSDHPSYPSLTVPVFQRPRPTAFSPSPVPGPQPVTRPVVK
ncbi:MAG: DUF1573 domain-containing protein [Verrucomicrobiota bacterium]